jgi:hypothetical protein
VGATDAGYILSGQVCDLNAALAHDVCGRNGRMMDQRSTGVSRKPDGRSGHSQAGYLAATRTRGTHHGQERMSSINRPDRLMQTKRPKGRKTLADRGRTIDGLPFVKRRAADSVLAAHIGCLRPSLVPLQNPDDLFLCEPARLHVHPLPGDGLYPFLEEIPALRSVLVLMIRFSQV